MASRAFEDIVADFAFLEDWEERYRYVIEQGRKMPAMDAALKVAATKVEGCASQVWLHPRPRGGVFYFEGDSDAIIVRGLIAILQKLYNGVPIEAIASVDAEAALGRLGLHGHLSAQRSNGLWAMIKRIQALARAQSG